MFYVYPAIFEKENEYYNVSFPDLPGCLTFGSGQKQAFILAEDALATWIGIECDDEEEQNPPVPSDITSLKAPKDGFVSLVRAAYHKPEELGLNTEGEEESNA